MEPLVRTATAEDLDVLASALAPDPSREQLANRLAEMESGYRKVLVAVVDGSAVGTVSYRHRPGRRPSTVRLFALDVGQEFRRKGIGTRLVQAVEQEAERPGAGSVSLEVATENSGAIALYERLGYSAVGKPFLNSWTRHTVSGNEQVKEWSVRMTKRIDG